MVQISGLQTGVAAAANNAGIIQSAYDSIKSSGGELIYPPGFFYINDYDSDGIALVFDADIPAGSRSNRVIHRGNRTKLQNVNPQKIAIRIGPRTNLDESGLGRRWTDGQTFYDMDFDNGMDVQRCTNPSGEDGNANGWLPVSAGGTPTGSVASYFLDPMPIPAPEDKPVRDHYGRRLRFTATAAQGGCYCEIETVPLQKYWITLRVVHYTDPNVYVGASATVNWSGQLSSPTRIGNITDPRGRVSLSFTASGTTSYILIRGDSQSAAGAIVDFRDVYCFEQQTDLVTNKMLIEASGMWNTSFHNCTFANSGHYLFGAQDGGYVNNLFENCTFSDSYMDGLDCKNNGDIGRGNKVMGCRFLRTSLNESSTYASAALDLSEGWDVTNVYFELLACNAGVAGGSALRFKTGANGFGSNRGTGGRRNSASDIRVEVLGVPALGFAGFHAQGPDNSISNLSVRGAHTAVWIQGSDTKVANIHAVDVNEGIIVQPKGAGKTTPPETGNNASISGGSIQTRDTGLKVSARTHVTGLDIKVAKDGAGIVQTTGVLDFTGGSIEVAPNGTGKQVIKSGGEFRARGVAGFKTDLAVSSLVDVSTTGTKTVTIPHGLLFAPDIASLIAHVRGSTADYQAFVSAVTSTAVIITVQVHTAGASTATVHCHLFPGPLPNM